MVSLEDAKDTLPAYFFIEQDAGYEEWLFGKVGETVERVVAGETGLHEHAEAMALLKGCLEARLRKTA